MTYKTIQDTIHGSIKFKGPFLELLETPELQRLRGIKQLGLANLVFPGANHTRLEHSIGAYRVAEKMADSLELDQREKRVVMAAALLHDIGHAPFSHTLESALADRTDKDHMDVTQDIITGERVIDERNGPPVSKILEDNGIDPEKVAELIKEEDESDVKLTDYQGQDGDEDRRKKQYLNNMIHGPLDVDQLDYLLRDSHYTGAVHGVVDIERLLQTVEIHEGKMTISKGGIPAIEGMLVARGLMYSSVYFHKTSRIAELMLSKAVEDLDVFLADIYTMSDWELLNHLKEEGGFQREMINRIKYRDLYKSCFSLNREELKKAGGIDVEEIGKEKKMDELRDKISQQAGITKKRVIVDVPYKGVQLSEPRLRKTGIKVFDGDEISALEDYSPLARALQKRPTQPWVMMVYCIEGAREKVRNIAEREIIR